MAAVDEIKNEIQAVEKLCHRKENPNLVITFRTGLLEGTPYYFIDMELCDYDLETYISDGKLYELKQSARAPQVIRIMKHITNGIAFLHSQNQVHRDLKPRNGN
jgi:serine/threonine protein kinase